MVMHIKDVEPLFALVQDFGLGGIVPCGAKQGRQLVGFCQALFSKVGNPEEHTRLVSSCLNEAEVSFFNSHELFLGHCANMSLFGQWFDVASKPLYENTGCVPVLITGLKAEDDFLEVLFSHRHSLGEPVLVRMLLGDIEQTALLMKRLIGAAKDTKNLPSFWPMFQASKTTSVSDWKRLSEELGGDFKYVCCAVDPFTSSAVRDFILCQTVVAQIFIGEETGIEDEMIIPPGMFSLYPDGGGYRMSEYISSFPEDKKDILIILGPSKPGWSTSCNIMRIKKVKSLLGQNGVDI